MASGYGLCGQKEDGKTGLSFSTDCRLMGENTRRAGTEARYATKADLI